MFPPAFATREEALKAAASTVKKLNKRRWFDRGDTVRRPEINDDDVAAMWEKLEGLYDEPDETDEPPVPAEPENEFAPPPDTANFLK
jgi:hypothetical protein